MRVWALTDGPVKEGKYLVVRRDGTTPWWPHFVMAAVDPCVPAALREYAKQARFHGFDMDFAASVEQLAHDYAAISKKPPPRGQKVADPDAGPHRVDNPTVIAMMRGETDVAALTADLTSVIEQLRIAREALSEIIAEVGTSTRANKIAAKALAETRG